MGVVIGIGDIIDRFVGVFSPHAAAKRSAYRSMLLKQRSQYAAAKSAAANGGWNPADSSNVNTVISNSSAALRKMARQLVRDMPAMATAVQRVEDFTVGNGITLQCRVKDETTGKLNQVVNRRIEDAWRRFCDEIDAGGKLHFHEIQQLACRQEIEVGEYVFIKRFTRSAGRFLPFDLMAIEPDQLTSYGANALPGNEIHDGVEFDPRSGKAMGYYFSDSDRWSKPIRYPANQVLLGFKSLRPNQLRGVTPLAPVILLAHQLRDFLEATIHTAQREARWLAFVTSQDPMATMAAFGGSQETDAAGNSYYSTEMGHAIVDFLRTGEDVKIANHNSPGSNFEPFVKMIHRHFAAAVGVTYELVSGDYNGSQYTSARVARNDMLKGIDIRRGRLIRQLCEPVKREFLFWAVTTGKLDLPGYFIDPEFYNRCVWMPPGVAQLDPLREGRAETDALADKRQSPQEILHARGRDPEQVLDEWQEWQEMLDARGLSMQEENTPIATNPDAVADQSKAIAKIYPLGTKNGK